MSSPSASPAPEPHPIFNTTYTLHSLPPLFSFPALTAASLKPHSRRLLQVFRGENLRGIALPPTSSEQTQLSRTGKLLSCVWAPLRPYRSRDDGDDDDEHDEHDEHDGGDRPIGVKIDVVYESASYTALLVSDGQASTADGFTRLPLLLSRLPGPLRQQLLDYLAANFDTLPLPLELPQTLLRHH